MGQGIAQLAAAPLVADPSGHADVEVELEIILELASAARKAMCNPAREVGSDRAQRPNERVVGVALVQKYRQPGLGRELQLRRECL